MGLFQVRVDVYSIRDPANAQSVDFIVDTGASLSVLPREIAERLQVEIEEKQIFQLANGAHVARDIGHVGFAYEGHRRILPVVVGERGDLPLLGALTLESWGYQADPLNKTLRKSQQYLLHAHARSPLPAPALS